MHKIFAELAVGKLIIYILTLLLDLGGFSFIFH